MRKFEKKVKGKMPSHFSYSGASTYENCPRLWKYRYLDAIDTSTTMEQEMGTFLHEVLMQINLLAKSGEDYVVNDIKKIFDKEWKNYNLGFNAYNIGWDAIEYYAKETFVQAKQIWAVEYEIKTIIKTDSGEIEMLGYIDRVDRVGNVVDIWEYKSWAMLQSKADLDDDFQTSLYTLYVVKNHPEVEEINIYYYSILNKKSMKVTKNLKEVGNVEDYTVDLWNKIMIDKEHKPKRCKLCQYCPKHCEIYFEYLKGINIPNVSSIEDKAKVLIDVLFQKSILKKEEEHLKEAIVREIEKNLGQPITLGEYVWGVEQKHRDAYSVNAVDYSQLGKKLIRKGKGKVAVKKPKAKK